MGLRILRIWNAPNIRPPPKPKFLKKGVLYSNKDFLGSWDVAILAKDKKLSGSFGNDTVEYLVQVKSKFRLKDFKLDQKVWESRCNLHNFMFWAVYDMKLRRKEEILLPHFKLYNIMEI